MAEVSLLERNRILNTIYGGEDFEIRAFSNTISVSGTGGTELTVDGYEPIEIANNTTNFPNSTTGTRSNAVQFQKLFDEAASIASIGIFSADGDFLGRKVFTSPLEVGAGQYWRFPTGSITFTLNNAS